MTPPPPKNVKSVPLAREKALKLGCVSFVGCNDVAMIKLWEMLHLEIFHVTCNNTLMNTQDQQLVLPFFLERQVVKIVALLA